MEYRSSVARLLAGLSIGIACAGLLASLALTSPEPAASAQGIGRGLLESAESAR